MNFKNKQDIERISECEDRPIGNTQTEAYRKLKLKNEKQNRVKSTRETYNIVKRLNIYVIEVT